MSSTPAVVPAAPASSIRILHYAVVTAAYWVFTLTDGALRTLVLLHFHKLGFSPITLAFLFVLYEGAGVVTNAVGGWLANKHGLRPTLLVGLFVQIIALMSLSALQEGWLIAVSVAFVMTCQALSGVAKDLTKMSSKSAIKVLVPDKEQGKLFKWVAILTGSKNALKGVGFFAGAVLLGSIGFQWSLWVMAAALLLVLIVSMMLLPGDIGQAKKPKSFKALFAKSRGINVLSAARLFLFASRDVWFVVGVPVFLHAVLHWDFWQVGAFLGAWTIAYGCVQSFAPGMLRLLGMSRAPGPRQALVLVLALLLITIALPLLLSFGVDPTVVLMVGLGLYGIVFALNSSVHSYLILAYSDRDEVAADVGFYYMSNAAGRLFGTVASGSLAWLGLQWGTLGGVIACLWGAVACVGLASLISVLLPAPTVQETHAADNSPA